jgi:hypothetical protein
MSSKKNATAPAMIFSKTYRYRDDFSKNYRDRAAMHISARNALFVILHLNEQERVKEALKCIARGCGSAFFAVFSNRYFSLGKGLNHLFNPLSLIPLI